MNTKKLIWKQRWYHDIMTNQILNYKMINDSKGERSDKRCCQCRRLQWLCSSFGRYHPEVIIIYYYVFTHKDKQTLKCPNPLSYMCIVYTLHTLYRISLGIKFLKVLFRNCIETLRNMVIHAKKRPDLWNSYETFRI